MMRQRFCLDGQWDFIYDARGQRSLNDLSSQTWQTVTVPAPWQTQIAGLEHATGSGWYRKQLDLPAPAADERLILHIGAAYHYARVWLNGYYLGDHDGGWLPFELDMTDAAQPGAANELVICVVVPDNDPQTYPDFPASEILHGKQTWYGSWGGLWQSVWIETRHDPHVTHLAVDYDLDSSILMPVVHLSAVRDNLSVAVTLLDAEQVPVLESERILPETTSITLPQKLPSALQRWSPDTPYLYTLRVSLYQDGERIDTLEKIIGFRTLETRDGQIWLNGKPFYMRGALDQDYYPQTLATPPSVEFLEDQLHKAKQMGLNTLRYHLKIADPRYYEVADRLGMLLWVDLPSWGLLTDRTKTRIKQTLQGMLKRDHHHPAIAIWTIVNEDWGTDLVHNTDHRQWLREMYHWLKAADESRLVVDNSPCYPNFHVESDIADYHYYYAMPDNRQQWDSTTRQLTARDSLPYSPNGDAHRTHREPVIVSEFGNWGLPSIDNLRDDSGRAPWWFETGHDWGEGIVYPHGVQQRFRQWHLDSVFGSWQALTEEMQWQQYRALKYEIESLRSHPEITGYVITELTDIHWENNGLLDMTRQPRIFADKLTRLNADTLVMARTNRQSYVSGEDITYQLWLSRLNPAQSPVVAVEWYCGDAEGRVRVPEADKSLVQLPAITFTQTVDSPQQRTLHLWYHLADGTRQKSNHYELYIFPPYETAGFRLAVTDKRLNTLFARSGHTLVNSQSEADAVVSRTLTPELTDFVRRGGRVLLIADHADALPTYTSGTVIDPTFPFTRLAERKTSIWNGDWVSTFTWLRRDRQFGSIPGSILLDSAFEDVLPEYVLTGFDLRHFRAQVSAGMFAGWLHRHVTLLGQRSYGTGQIMLTTFKLTEANPDNPLHQHLLDGILQVLLPALKGNGS